jgi:hypothetical protein
MAKSVNDGAADAYLNWIKDNCNEMNLCSQEPTTYTEATNTYSLADVALTSGDFTGPVNGDTSGRKITVAEKSGVSVDVTGTGNHVALTGVVNSTNTLQVVTTCPNVSVTAGGNIIFASWDIEVGDPS